MAKGTDDPPPISEDSIGYLEDVKKGKARKFAMICKGPEVISLVVYKKGTVEKFKKEAKQSGKGQFYFGVVDGRGIDIRFVLARADGFESAPVKSTSLKGFLDEAAELKCKPYFEIVDAVPFVLDEDDPLVARFLKLQEPALQACDAHADRAAEINALCLEIGGHLDRQQSDEASVKLDELERLLDALAGAIVPPAPPPPTSQASVASQIPPAPPAPPAPPVASEQSALEAKLVEILSRLKPMLIKAIEMHPTRKAELVDSVTLIRDELKNKQYSMAQSNLVVLGKLLKTLVAAPPVDGPPPQTTTETAGDPATLFNQRLKALLPEIKGAAGTAVGDQIKSIVGEAGAFARQQDFVLANDRLDQVQELLSKSIAQDPQAGVERQEGEVEDNDNLKLRKQFEAAKLRVEPKLEQARQANPDKSDTLLKPWNFARDQALDGKLASAIAAVERLETAIDKMLSAATTGESNPPAPSDAPRRSVVALQQSLLAWEAACKQMQAKLQTFEQEILSLFDNDPRLADVKRNIRKLDAVLGDYAEELRDRLDEAYNAPDEFKPQACSEALEVLARYRSYLNADPFIKATASNLLMPIDVEGVLGKTLDMVAKNLGG